MVDEEDILNLSKNMRRQVRMEKRINKWLKANGSSLVWDARLSYERKRMTPMINVGSFKIQPGLKKDLQRWADKESVTLARYIRDILHKWSRVKKAKDKAKINYGKIIVKEDDEDVDKE